MKSARTIARSILKGIIDTYISIECWIIRTTRSLFLYPYHTSNTRRKKVLILRKDVIGDFILFIPTLKYYREFYKDMEVSLVVNTVALELLSQFSFINTIIPYDGKKFRTNFFYRRKFMHNLAKQGFDIVVHSVYSREYIGDRMVRATGAEETITFRSDRGSMKTDSDYSRIIDVPEKLSEPERNMYFAREVTGLDCALNFPTLDIQKFDHSVADSILQKLNLKEKEYCVLLAGAGAFYRTWQLEKFAEVAEYIVEKYNLTVLLCGSKGDIKLSEELFEKIENKSKIINITGSTDLPNFAHILHKSVFYFGSETGPLHLATAINTPVVCILGGGHFDRFFPYGNPNTNRYIADDDVTCRGDGWKCSQNLQKGEIAPCIRNISVSDATKEIEALFAIIRP